MRPNLILALIGLVMILFGIIGMGLYRIGEHIYIDHTNHHAIVTLIQQSQKPQPETAK